MRDSRNLDLLRAIAVMLVVGAHIGGFMRPSAAAEFELMGRCGVAIFFVHTCLVLMLSLERRGEGAVAFLVRRFFRIYPLALAIVLLIALGNGLAGAWPGNGAVIANLLLVQNVTGHESVLAPLWSLPYEVQMYMALPAVFLLARAGGARAIATLVAAAVVGIVALMAAGLPYSLLQYLPCFLPGVLAFVIGWRPRLHPAALFAVVGVGVASICALVSAGLPEIPLFWVFCLALGVTIPNCRQIRSQLLARAGALIAKYSYSIYLTHLFATKAAFVLAAGLHPALQWVVLLLVLVAWARVGYRWIEAPGIALGARIAEGFRATGALVKSQ